jgi:putative membrane protein
MDGPVMSLGEFLLSAWLWEPSVILGCLGLSLAYAVQNRFRLDRRTLSYQAGVLILFLALVSPLDVLADDYLFSAHMVQHLLLVLIVAPLMLLGINPQWIRDMLRWKPAAKVEALLGYPPAAWILGVGTLYLWHIPSLYNWALDNEGVHSLEHLSFLVTACIFWWPVILPLPEKRRLSLLNSMLYIFAGAVANTVLGIILTFTPAGSYPAYLNPADTLGILPMIRGVWGLDPQTDQQLGGLIMWIPGGLIYLTAILAAFSRWYSQPEAEMATNQAGRG